MNNVSENNTNSTPGKKSFSGLGLALGAGIGAAMGAATDDMAVWLALGVAIGLAFEPVISASRNKKQNR